jgi:rhodanese-related sulfurtransferase
MNVITAQELKKLIDADVDFQLIDVREPYEYEEVNISATLIPMNEFLDRSNEIATDKKVVIHCRSGKRSAAIIDAIEREKGIKGLYNLEGGILAYLELIG